ncbi:TolB-like translocation protein [Conexibacter woesei]|uniref:WD40 domain protein beta Propeller n=1 Tax=Conexibacter woesei (strain DSM 14684 / CCUG 47730 / CIP 108061 / JCM 11494 / NBRC 100937 / ID131577) TaxID=469383 RepID=D3FA82_CONWI|nr:PD40 domain-containing protein [Conexibacter woesei]ADB53177.1 hypothetical protein Cwoe_4764 [Conexibacter woesei DSM 14684]
MTARHRRTRRAAAAAVLGTAALAAAVPSAGAAWGEAQLVSVDNGRREQADGPTSAVDVSGDGRFVVFQTRASNFFADDDPDAPGTVRQGGVFRFDRQTGAIALVAGGDLLDDGNAATQLRRGAARPSVSDDGRWVVFSTAQPLVPQDDNDNVDVYVRDMSRPPGVDRATSGAYQLVSARDGGDEPAHYARLDTPLPGRNPGADVYSGQAISGDGRYVAFRTTELASDLPASAAVDTPPGNVFVRDLVAKRTVLVTKTMASGGPAGGALAGVVLSRDGSTVAWTGANGAAQTRLLTGESQDEGRRYYLWRRWDDAGAVTRRVTGAADPDDPACPADGRIVADSTATGPCFGPLADPEDVRDVGGLAPALSADGWTVAFLTLAGARPSNGDDAYLDAYTTSMGPGATRKSATRVATKGTTASNPRANGDVDSVALSADGSRLVIVTTRRELLPPAPPLAGETRASLPLTGELYTLDLGPGGATRRVLTYPPGGEVDGAIDPNPAVSADGRSIVFTTRAANLVRGDANELPDAFAVSETDERRGGAPPTGLGQDQVNVDVGSEDDELRLRAVSRRDGTLLLRVRAPEPGALRAIARTVPVKRGRARARRSPSKGRAPAATRARQVAQVRGRARRRGTVQLVLRLTGAARTAVRKGTPLPVRVTVTLTPSRRGAKPRRSSVTATFRVPARRRAASRRGKR